MNELSLFSGAGGGLLGTMLLGFRPIGYVEWDDYCQRVIAARIRDGMLPDAPIFGDIREFINQGYAASYTGLVDVLTAGFPCPPFSVAGKRRGEADSRNMWPSTIETIRIVRPRYVFLENVPGLLSSGQALILIALEKVRQFDLFGAKNSQSFTGRFIRHIFKVAGMRYFGRVLGDLAESGYDAEWTVLGADDCGAPHIRKRVWIFAHAVSLCGNSGDERTGREEGTNLGGRSARANVANPIGNGSGSRRAECEGQQGRFAPFGASDAQDSIRIRRAAGISPLPGQEGGATLPCDADRQATHAPEVHDGRYFRGAESGQVSQPRNGIESETSPHSPGREAHSAEPGGLYAEPCGEDSGVSPDALRLNGDDAGFCAGEISQLQEAEVCGSDVADANETGRGEQWRPEPIREEQPTPECGLWSEQWPEVAARLCVLDDGVAHRVDRLKAIGNGQVPICMATAFRFLLRGIR